MKLVGAEARRRRAQQPAAADRSRSAAELGGQGRNKVGYIHIYHVMFSLTMPPGCAGGVGRGAVEAMLGTGKVVRGIQGRLQHAGNAAGIARRSGNRRAVKRSASLLLPGLRRGAASTATTGTPSTSRAGYSTTAPAERGEPIILDTSKLQRTGRCLGVYISFLFAPAEKEPSSRRTHAFTRVRLGVWMTNVEHLRCSRAVSQAA